MPVGIGGVGDIIAIIGVVREFASALNGTRGSAAEYQEVRRELDGLEKALLCHHQLLQARCDDPALNAIFRSTQSTAEDCRKCIEAFSQQTVKFDRSLGVDPSGNVCRDVMMKVRWQMSKKEEVVRFRAQLGQHISSLIMLFGLANLNMQRDTHDKIDSKLDVLEDKIDSNSKIHETSITELQEHIDKGMTQNENAVKTIREDLRLGWLRQLGSELKGLVSQIFTISGTTLSAIQRIEQRLPSHSEMTLIRTFTLEDAIGRITRVDMIFVSSWDAFHAMLEGCFREFPGHKMVARKQYVFQDQKTNREIKRSIPWSGALVPGQYINMGLVFRKRSSKNKRSGCPYCHLALEQSQDGLIPCKCGMSHQRRTEIMNVDEEEDMPTFDLPDAPSSDMDNLPELNDSVQSSPVQAQSVGAVDLGSQVEYEDMSSFRRVIVVEVEMNIIPSKPLVSESTRPQNDTPAGDTSYGAYNTQPRYYTCSATATPPSGLSPRQYSRNTSGDAYGYSPRGAFSPRYNSAGNYMPAKATEVDARKHRIPLGYSLKNWDATKEPIMLLGSVFDGNSLGKWIYDWTIYCYGPATQIADVAAELRLLLIQLVGKIKLAEECMGRILKRKNRDMVDDFIESGDRLMDKFKKLLKSCETPMLRAGKRKRKKKKEQTAQVMTVESSPNSNATLNAQFDKILPAQVQSSGPSSTPNTTSLDPTLSSSTSSGDKVTIKEEANVSESEAKKMLGKEFVDSIFGRDKQLETTKILMASMRLWNLRFDENCEDILRNPLL